MQECSTFRFAHITDLHLADNDFANHKPGQQEELWRMLDEVRDLCVQERRHLIITGDFFERKSPRLNSHALVHRLMLYCASLEPLGLRVIAIAGNHDLGADGMASLARQPLGVLALSGAVELLVEPAYYSLGGEAGPWLQISPLNFEDRAEYDPDIFRIDRSENVAVHMVLAHAALSSVRHRYPFDHIPYEEVPNEGIDVVLWGHMHEDHGVEEVNGTIFANCGSFCRRSRKQQRPVRIALGEITAESISIEPYEVQSASPWQEIFNDVVDSFEPIVSPGLAELARDAASLYAFEEMDFKQVLQHIATEANMEKGVTNLAAKYLEEAEHAAGATTS